MRTFALATLALSVLALSAVACTQSTDEAVSASESAIVGGTEAEPGAWAGAVALYKGGSRPSCGGSLIADSWVLTAGHCVTPTSATGGVSSIAIGRHKLSDTTTGETRTVDRAIRHAGYANLDNDLALLHLSEPSSLPKAKLVSAAQLVAIIEGADTTVVGWGRTAEGGGPVADALRQVTVPVISNDVCKAFPRYDRVTPNMICAGFTTGQFDSCQGDSGGPLYMNINDEKVQVGLVSWGIGCARPNAPGVYTRVGNYLSWIFENTEGAAGEAPAPTPAPEPTPEPTPAPTPG